MVDRHINKKPHQTHVGTDSTGAEYWLVPFNDNKIGNRRFEVRKCSPNKKVPVMLQGMITDAATGFRLFEKWQLHEKAKKSTSKATADE